MSNKKIKYLLKGDVSGIQEFIFNVSTKGAAKTLKARSYFVQVISHMAYQKALTGLPDAEELYDGGGSFFVVFQAENKNDAESHVLALRNTINESLKQHDLDIVIAYVPIGQKIGEAWTHLRKETNIEKLCMHRDTEPFFDAFDKDRYNINLNSESVSEEVIQKINQLGYDLTDGNPLYFAIAQELVKNENFQTKLFDIAHQQTKRGFDGRLVNKLPFWESYTEYEAYEEYRKKHASDYWDNSELTEGNIIDFDAFGDFAAHRTGTNKIAVLKLDVDNLGNKFGKITGTEKANKLSKQYADFFDKELFNIYKNKCFYLAGEPEKFEANIYPIFAGGDDCFIIGAWDAVLCFTEALQRKFEDSFDQDSTVSAGIVIVDPTLPVKAFSEMAEEALAKAKSSPGKNKVILFDLVFSWKDYKYIMRFSGKLRELMDAKNINRGYLDKVRKSAKGFNALQNHDGVNFDKIYKLKYYISCQNEDLAELVELLFKPYYESLKSKLKLLKEEDAPEHDTAIYPVTARLTDLLTRKKLEYE